MAKQEHPGARGLTPNSSWAPSAPARLGNLISLCVERFTAALDGVAPALDQVSFAMIGLGDRAYEPYYQTAAERLRDRLTSFGGREAVAMLEVDGAPSPAHLTRARKWATGLAKEFAVTGRV